MTLIDIYLQINAAVLCLVGPALYFTPKKVAALWHISSASLQTETISVMAGWGAAVLALGVISLLMSRSVHFNPKRIVASGLLIGWLAIAHGSYVMWNNKYFGEWNQGAILAQLVGEMFMTAASAYFAFIYRESLKLHQQ